MRLGDVVLDRAGLTGQVVANIDCAAFSPEYPESEWAHLARGVLVLTEQGGLVHYQDTGELNLADPKQTSGLGWQADIHFATSASESHVGVPTPNSLNADCVGVTASDRKREYLLPALRHFAHRYFLEVEALNLAFHLN